MLHEFIAVNREEIIRRCRAKVATRSIPPPTEAEIDHGVPVFLHQLRDALRLRELTSPEISRSAIKHGHDLLRQGFTTQTPSVRNRPSLVPDRRHVGGPAA